MMNNQKLHEEVKTLARIYLESEKNLIGPLIRVKQLKAYRDFECHGLDDYCEKQLGFSESVARMFQTVVNHAVKKPALREALETDRLSVTYASKIVSQLTDENIDEVLEFAQDHSIGETEEWLAEKQGGPQYRTMKLTLENIKWLFEERDLMPGNLDFNQALSAVLLERRKKRDPVEKAKRAAKSKRQESSNSFDLSRDRDPDEYRETVPAAQANPAKPFRRKPLTAEQRRAIDERDEHRCTHRSSKGERCKEKRWLDHHHVILVSNGGGNEPENIVTLCAEHHDLAHQTSFPLDDLEVVNLPN